MSQFVVTKKKLSTSPDADRWEEVVEQTAHVEVLQYGFNKMVVEHPDEAILHVAVSDVADVKRVS